MEPASIKQVLHQLSSRYKGRISVAQQHSLVDSLCQKIQIETPSAKLHLVRAAGSFAIDQFVGLRRKNGKPFFTHQLAVAELLTGIHIQRAKTYAAALVHDLFERRGRQTEPLLLQVLAEADPEHNTADAHDVAGIVQGVTELEGIEDAETLSMAQLIRTSEIDIRPLLLRLGDRLHNQEDFRGMSRTTKRRKSEQTRNFFAPLAGRLGLWPWRCALYDTTLRDLEPQIYTSLSKQTSEFYEKNVCTLLTLQQELQFLFGEAVDIMPTPRCLWDIMKESQARGEKTPTVQPIDISSFTVVLDSDDALDTFHAFGRLCAKEALIAGSFVDGIHTSTFVSPFYRALAASFQTSHGAVRLHIQTRKMYERGLLGVIARSGKAHTWYEDGKEATERIFTFARERGFVGTQVVAAVAPALDVIHIRTPEGKIIDVEKPKNGSPPTVLDFAAEVDPSCLPRVAGAIIDGVAVSYKTELTSFAEVELRLDANPTYDSGKLEAARTQKTLAAFSRSYEALLDQGHGLSKENIIQGGRELLLPLLNEYLLELGDFERLAVFKKFLSFFWRRILKNEWNPRLTVDNLYYLFGIGELKPLDFVTAFMDYYASLITRAERTLHQKEESIPTVTYRISIKKRSKLLSRLSRPWARFSVEKIKESQQIVARRTKQIIVVSLTLSCLTKLMRLQIERQIALFRKDRDIISIEEVFS